MGRVYGVGNNQEGQLGLGHCNNTTSFHPLHPFCDHAPIKMLSAGCKTSAALTGLVTSNNLITVSARYNNLLELQVVIVF